MGLDTNFVRTSRNAYEIYKQNLSEDGYNIKDKYVTIRMDDVAYFRKFWSLLRRLHYTDENYGKYVEVPKEKIKELRDEAKKTIMMVEKYLKEKGWEIEHSPLERVKLEGDYTKWLDECISLKNGVFTESLEEECDEICNEVYEEPDAFLFRKTITLYQTFSDILDQTDFEKELILHESDW